MSTRSTTHFIGRKGEKPEAIVYRHADGYPEGHGKDLQRFFDDVEAQTKDTRFNDPSYLAAKLIVWLAREFAVTSSYDADGVWSRTNHANERPLDFISVGVVREDPGDIEYRYIVESNDEGRPTVTWEEVV
jgi:hypothetical protein